MKIGTTTYEGICYGPIHSRRLGQSLGINLMPGERKLCSFNCVYCECGWNGGVRPGSGEKGEQEKPVLPTREQVKTALEVALKGIKAGLDVITFSGNGEPTLHPDFNGIIRDTRELRDRYFPSAKITVLSNSTQLGREDVREGLMLCDNPILKMDAATDEMMRRIDLPVSENFNTTILKQWLGLFKGDFTLQTCLLRGEMDGKKIDNTTPEEVEAWYRAVDELRPKQIMLYAIDRKTPLESLEKVSGEEMERIARPLRDKGYNISISL